MQIISIKSLLLDCFSIIKFTLHKYQKYFIINTACSLKIDVQMNIMNISNMIRANYSLISQYHDITKLSERSIICIWFDFKYESGKNNSKMI